MFEIFRKRKPQRPQISPQYPLFTAPCRLGVQALHVTEFEKAMPTLKDANVSVLTNGSVIVYDENTEKPLEFFSARDIREPSCDFPQFEDMKAVMLSAKQRKFMFCFDSQKDKSVFWTVLRYAREKTEMKEVTKRSF